MSVETELRKYIAPALLWIARHLDDPQKNKDEKKKLILFREFIKEQLPNENSHSSAR